MKYGISASRPGRGEEWSRRVTSKAFLLQVSLLSTPYPVPAHLTCAPPPQLVAMDEPRPSVDTGRPATSRRWFCLSSKKAHPTGQNQEPSLSDSFWTCSRILIPHCLGRRLPTSGAGRALTSRLDLFLGVCRTALERDEKAPPRSSPETRAPQGKRHLTSDSLAAGLLQFALEALNSAGSYLEGHQGPPTIPC